jgi:hypothetical protein
VFGKSAEDTLESWPATATHAPIDDGESNGEPAEQSPGTDVDDA